MHYVEWFVLRWMIFTAYWMIFTALNDLYYVGWFVLREMICTGLNDLYCVEWFVRRWMSFYFLAKFVRPRMICTVLKKAYYVEWIRVLWMICTTLNHLGYDGLLAIGLMRAKCAYSKKHCKIFYTKLWVDFFLIWKHQEKIFLALLQ